MLVATVLVIMMSIPGLALFYGGLVRSKNMLSVLMQVFVIFSLIVVLWAIYGYSLAFTEDGRVLRRLRPAVPVRDLHRQGRRGLVRDGGDVQQGRRRFPSICSSSFQATFAAITVALIVGAFAERMKFSAVLLFAVAVVHVRLSADRAHGVVLARPGWHQGRGARSTRRIGEGAAGCGRRARSTSRAAPSCTSMRASRDSSAPTCVGKRVGYGKESMAPHNLTFTMIGASLLWVGWFGFNAGSALEAGDTAALAFINTLLATAAAVLSWMVAEWMLKGKPSMLGAASGAVAGLVAITPACGFVGSPARS